MRTYKLLPRLMAAFGLLVIFSIDGWGNNTYFKAERSFTTNHAAQKLATFNIKGDFNITGASVQCAVNASNQCITNPTNTFTTKTKHIKNEPSLSNLNSASATLEIPTGATIKWAGLLWQGHIHGLKSGIGNPANADAIANAVKNAGTDYDIVKFKTPDGTEHTIDIDHNDTSVMNHFSLEDSDEYRFFYQGFKDVTDIVKNSYSSAAKTFTVGDIKSTDGDVRVMKDPIDNWADEIWSIGNHGNWSLVVVFEEPNYTLQNVSVYDGFKIMKVITNGDRTTPMNIPIHIDGFLTPSSGTVQSKLMFYAGGGNKSADRDSFEILNANTGVMDKLSNGVNPFNNVFNDTFSYFGTNVNSMYHHLMDIDTFDISSKMDNSQSQTDLNLYVQYNNGADIAFVGLVAFSTELYQPNICYVENIFKGTTNISGVGAQVNVDDNLTVRVYLKNTGNEIASKVQVQHQFDNLFPYVANSANYNNSNPTYQTVMPPSYTRTAATDSSGNDLYEYNTTSLLGKINLGINANSTEGGDFNSSSSAFPTYAVFEYNATVKAVDSNYSNIYKASYVNAALGIDYSANPIILSSCDGSINSFYGYSAPAPATSADIIDTFTTIASYNDGTQKYIGTKISDKSNVTITAVHLDSGGQAAAYAPSNSSWKFSVIPFWSDGTCTETENVLNAANEQVVIDISNASAAATGVIKVKSKAHKNSRFKVIVVDPATLSVAGQQCIASSSTTGNFARLAQCANSEVQYTAAFGSNAWSRCGLGGGLPCKSSNGGVADPTEPSYNPLYHNELGCYMCTFDITPTCSTDNFAIRPDRLDVNSSHLHMPNLLRSAQDYNMTIKAYDYNTTINTTDYNVTNANTIFSMVTKMYDRNNIERNSTTIPEMYGTSSFAASDFNISNGLSKKAGILSNEVVGLSFDDVGKINISIKDQQWSAVDINNAIDPTAHDCSANGAYACGDKNVTFIPEHFDFSELNITNNNGNPGSFTYIANEVDKMAGRIQTKIRAMNKNSAVTHNFNQTPLWENPITVVPVISKPTYLYPDANETNITNTLVGFGIGTDANGTKTIAWNETNTSKYLRFNFRRDTNQTANAFKVVGTDLNISIVSTYIDGAKQADINGSRLGTGANDLPYVDVSPADGNSTFVYGRIIPRDVRVFGSVGFSANAWYEIYSSPTLNATNMPASKNESMWYTNTFHTDNIDGNGTVSQMSSGNLPNNTTYAAGVKTYNFNASATIPYSAKAHIDTDPWLWYGATVSPYLDPSAGNLDCLTHPCFNVNVVPAVGATGSAKYQDGTTTEMDKSSKASTSGGGAWRSTSDYAPAVR